MASGQTRLRSWRGFGWVGIALGFGGGVGDCWRTRRSWGGWSTEGYRGKGSRGSDAVGETVDTPVQGRRERVGHSCPVGIFMLKIECYVFLSWSLHSYKSSGLQASSTYAWVLSGVFVEKMHKVQTGRVPPQHILIRLIVFHVVFSVRPLPQENEAMLRNSICYALYHRSHD